MDDYKTPPFFTGSERNPDNMGNSEPYGQDETQSRHKNVLDAKARQAIRDTINQATLEALEEFS
jgi:hypothetical protein